MTLLITIFAAIICTVVWYIKAPDDDMKISTLCYLYWGASLMWLADAVFEYIDMREEFFRPTAPDMINDLYLGLSVVALGLIVWLVNLLIKDPRGVVKASLFKKNNNE